MSTYRVYFLGSSGIAGRMDVVADDDDDAVATANVLCDACSDCCDSFEVWSGVRRIVGRTPSAPLSSGAGRERWQAAIIVYEQAIQRSQWAIANSQRLLKRTAELRASDAARLTTAR